MASQFWLGIKIRLYWLIITFPKRAAYRLWYLLCLHLPLENKVIASTFKGKKYGDNPQFIYEELHRQNPSLHLLWRKDETMEYLLPNWVKSIEYTQNFSSIYHLATAKVVIDTHRFPVWIKKRRGQLFIETWHGGLGIKKIEADVPAFKRLDWLMSEVRHTCQLSDVFISQSEHLSKIYRRAFGYNGQIFKCGFPKNDCLFNDTENVKKKVRDILSIPESKRIFLYVPSFRDYFYSKVDTVAYNVDFPLLRKVLLKRFGCDWTIVVRWHPLFVDELNQCAVENAMIVNATDYPDIQELLMASDIVMSDYSSCIFDAALLDIPCFTFATDFDEYKAQRGVYYEMDELPFPYARNNEELRKNIENYDHEAYLKHWYAFKDRMGLYEPGNASEVIAQKILEFVETGKTNWI